eukprot:UN21754
MNFRNRERSFWTLISRSFFWKTIGRKTQGEAKTKNKGTNMETLPNKYLRETHVPYFNKKGLEDEESVQQPQATDN